jgi:hypothetical protein
MYGARGCERLALLASEGHFAGPEETENGLVVPRARSVWGLAHILGQILIRNRLVTDDHVRGAKIMI